MIKLISLDDAIKAMLKECRWKLETYCTRYEYYPVTDKDFCSKVERRLIDGKE